MDLEEDGTSTDMALYRRVLLNIVLDRESDDGVREVP